MRYVEYFRIDDNNEPILIDTFYETSNGLQSKNNPDGLLIADVRIRCKTLEDIPQKMQGSYTTFGPIQEDIKVVEKMQTEPQMSPEIKQPTQMIGEKPKRRIRIRVRRQTLQKDSIQQIVSLPE
jgi:hypothetical protein